MRHVSPRPNQAAYPWRRRSWISRPKRRRVGDGLHGVRPRVHRPLNEVLADRMARRRGWA